MSLRLLLPFFLLLAGCKIEVVVPEGGTVETESGSLSCGSGETCVVNVSNVFFDETFVARAGPGYAFDSWRKRQNAFAGGSRNPSVRLFTTLFAGNETLLAFIEADTVYYLEPVFVPPEEAAPGAYQDNVAESVVAERCAVCHLEGGLSGFTRLVFDHLPSSQQDANNIDVFRDFLAEVDDGREYLLTKVRGGAGHGGGSVFSAASDEYQALAAFLSLLEGVNPDQSVRETSDFWEGVQLADGERTLRRAAIIVSGRAPTDAEYSQATAGEEGLRDALLGLMEGDGFHQFLVEGANDRLLTDAFLGPLAELLFLPGSEYFPLWSNRFVDIFLNQGEDQAYVEAARVLFGMARSPSELVAYVVEQDRPYTEILTANYAMLNPALAAALGADVTFDNPSAINSFKPSRYQQVLVDENVVGEEVNAFLRRYTGNWTLAQIPHAGILSSYAFLERYPTTETNRNRARARWTYQFFLGVDIEKSAGRTTDPAALADTNNPTLYNPNCTVCHQIMDPVAGAFQNFGNQGLYRNTFGGTDSLPDTYKYPQFFDPDAAPSPYREGDTWFRDMRSPGFDGKTAPSSNGSLQWLARQITSDPRFAKATVEFWWPAVMGAPVLEAPEISRGANYADRLTAFEAQQADIAALGEDFRQHFNLRQLLADMLLNPWFRADSGMALGSSRRAQLADAGTERLLTPEQMERKLLVLAGYQLEPITPYGSGDFGDLAQTLLTAEYRNFLGGIDSGPVRTRATTTTSVVTQALESVALSSACGVVLGEFQRAPSQRSLFTNVDMLALPENNASAARSAIQGLHRILLGEDLPADHEEIQATYDLLVGARQDYQYMSASNYTNEDVDARCWVQDGVDDAFDPEHVLKAWTAVMAYLLMDYRFVHE